MTCTSTICIHHRENLLVRRRVAVYKDRVPGENGQSQPNIITTLKPCPGIHIGQEDYKLATSVLCHMIPMSSKGR